MQSTCGEPRTTAKGEDVHQTGDPPVTPRDEALDRTVKQLEWWQLLRSALPLIAAGIGVAWLYGSMAASSDAGVFWLGTPLGLAGSACAVVGYAGRLREIRSPETSTGRHYPWLFIGWALVAAGALIPPYSVA